jgi:hypothetical protein
MEDHLYQRVDDILQEFVKKWDELFARFESSFAEYKNGVQQLRTTTNGASSHIKPCNQKYHPIDIDHHNHMLTDKEETAKDGEAKQKNQTRKLYCTALKRGGMLWMHIH